MCRRGFVSLLVPTFVISKYNLGFGGHTLIGQLCFFSIAVLSEGFVWNILKNKDFVVDYGNSG